MSNKRKVRHTPLTGLPGFVTDPKPVEHQVVAIGFCSGGTPELGFLDSLSGILLHDSNHGRHVCSPGGATISLLSGPRIAEARSQIVDHFLDNPLHARTQWLLMLDDDMTAPGDLVERLLAYAHPTAAPIVGGFCVGGAPHRQFTTVYRAYNDDDGELAVEAMKLSELPETGLVKVGATGAACLLVHRWVYIEMRKRFATLANGRPNPYPWFVEGLTTPKGFPLGEDIAFCRRAMLMDIPVHVAMDVELGHIKKMEMNKETLRAFEEVQARLVEAAAGVENTEVPV